MFDSNLLNDLETKPSIHTVLKSTITIRKDQHLHAPECINAVEETVEVLEQYRWMNRKSFLEDRQAV